ncbi:hypothetical protein P9272_35815, partial [Mesorhizobium sp. WSM4976]|uniref:hypothetical protein n=1 Tax=Mesorhizobium sp. WSM4976 TaxID=3038549 RepID=UPI00241703BA
DVYGPPLICKGIKTVMTDPVLAVVYPAWICSRTAAGPDGIRGSAARQMDELVPARIIQGTFAEPGPTGLPSHSLTLASQRRPPAAPIRSDYAVTATLRVGGKSQHA